MSLNRLLTFFSTICKYMRSDTIGSELDECDEIVPRVAKTIQTHLRCMYVSVCMLAISGESPQYNAKRSATVKRPKKKLYFQVPDNVGERRDKVPRVKAVDNSMHSCCCCCC